MRKEAIDKALESFHLTYSDYQVLRVLHYLDGVSLEYLEHETHYDTYVIEHIIHRLKETHFIEIKHNQIYLTEQIKKIYPQVMRTIQGEDDKLMKQLSKEEHNEMVEILDKLIEYYE